MARTHELLRIAAVDSRLNIGEQLRPLRSSVGNPQFYAVHGVAVSEIHGAVDAGQFVGNGGAKAWKSAQDVCALGGAVACPHFRAFRGVGGDENYAFSGWPENAGRFGRKDTSAGL